MKTLIVYSSKYGTAKKCAIMLAQKLEGKVEVMDLKRQQSPLNLVEYNKVIIGSPIYIGKIQKEVKDFCSNYLDSLKEKKIGIFTCGLQKEQEESKIKEEIPQTLLSSVVVIDCFGGELTYNKLGFWDKLIIKIVTKSNKDISTVSEEKICNFAKVMNKL